MPESGLAFRRVWLPEVLISDWSLCDIPTTCGVDSNPRVRTELHRGTASFVPRLTLGRSVLVGVCSRIARGHILGVDEFKDRLYSINVYLYCVYSIYIYIYILCI